MQVISTVSGGSIIGALYYLHVKNLLESKADAEIADADYVELVRAVEQEYREAAASNVRGSGWANLLENFKMAKPTYSRTDRVAELYERRFYAKAWGDRPKRNGRIAMRDLLIEPKGHDGPFDPDEENPRRNAPVPILLLEATTLNTGHNWRFEAMYVGEPPRQGTADQAAREDVDKNVILERTRWEALPEACQNFPLGGAVASSACFPGGFPPMVVPETLRRPDDRARRRRRPRQPGRRGARRPRLHAPDHQRRLRPDARHRAALDPPACRARPRDLDLRRRRARAAAAAAPARGRLDRLHAPADRPACARAHARRQVSEKEAKIESTDFGVLEDVQRALAQVRTDLDSFCEVEAWSLMADAYQLTGRIVPTRAGLAALGTPGPDVEWPFEVVAEQLAQPSKKYLKLLHSSKERFFKPARMLPPLLPVTLLLLLAALGAAVYGLWLLLTPHGTALFIVGLAALGVVAIYANSENKFVKPVAIGIFDVVLPALLAIPLVLVSLLQLGAGRWWLSLGRAKNL